MIQEFSVFEEEVRLIQEALSKYFELRFYDLQRRINCFTHTSHPQGWPERKEYRGIQRRRYRNRRHRP